MAICPILSYKQKETITADRTIVGTVETSSGTTDSEYWKCTAITADANDEVVYNTGTGADGDFDSNGFFHCFQSSQCQFWDNVNGRCGLVTSDYIRDSTSSEADAVVNLIKGIIGDYPERDNGASLIVWLKNMIGIESQRDDSTSSIVIWLKDMIGTKSERDENSSLTSWIKNMIGIKSERDNDLTLIGWLKNIIGIDSEKDDSSTLLVWLKSVVGMISEIDTDPTHQIGSLLKTETHVHNEHNHFNDPNHEHPYTSPPPAAMTLISEFMSNEDQDGGKGPGTSIYGKDFMITENSECPPALKSIHQHSDWVDPGYSVPWSTYQSW